MSKKIKQPQADFFRTQQVERITASGEFARTLQWVYRARSVDSDPMTLRIVMVNRVWITTKDGKRWAIATDGRRAHYAVLEIPAEIKDGVYVKQNSRPDLFIAELDVSGMIYPNAWQVIPDKSPDVKSAEVNLGYGINRPATLFNVVIKAATLNAGAFQVDFLNDATRGQDGTVTLRQKSACDPLVIETATRIAVIMPCRIT